MRQIHSAEGGMDTELAESLMVERCLLMMLGCIIPDYISKNDV